MQSVKNKIEEANRIMAYGVIPNIMQNSNPPITNITIDGIGRITLTDVLNVTVPADNKPKVYEWLRDAGFENLITETVNAQTFAAFVRRQIKEQSANTPEEKRLPLDLMELKPETRASITAISKTI
jgi:hypothetical protein